MLKIASGRPPDFKAGETADLLFRLPVRLTILAFHRSADCPVAKENYASQDITGANSRLVSMFKATIEAATLCNFRTRLARRDETERLLAINSHLLLDIGLSFKDKLKRNVSE